MENNLYDNNTDTAALSAKLREDFKTAALWARIIAMAGMVSAVASVISNFSMGRYVIGLFGAAFAVLIYLFVYRFGQKIKEGLANKDTQAFNEGLLNLSYYFKVMGYLVIACIGFVILAIVFGMLGAFLGKSI